MNAASLSGRVAIVTGAGKGLGRAFALDLAAKGVAVVVNNRHRDRSSPSSADEVVEEIKVAGGDAVADYGSVEDPDTAARLIETARTTFGRLDICITSAGIVSPQVFHKTDSANFAEVLAVNVAGTALLASAAYKFMRQSNFGRIVLLASTAGLHGEPTAAAYAASKGAVIALGKTIAVEGASRGVHTNVILPYALTQMTDSHMTPEVAALMQADKIPAVVSALVDPDCDLNGEILVSGGNGLRTADAAEGGTVRLPGTDISAEGLAELVAQSRSLGMTNYADADAAFESFTNDLS